MINVVDYLRQDLEPADKKRSKGGKKKGGGGAAANNTGGTFTAATPADKYSAKSKTDHLSSNLQGPLPINVADLGKKTVNVKIENE